MTNLSSHAGGALTRYWDSTLMQGLITNLLFYNDGENEEDQSGNFAPGTVVGATNSAQIQGNGWVFDGAADTITYADPSDILDTDGTDARSWAFWLEQNSTGNEEIMTYGANNGHTGIGWCIMTNLGTDVYFQLNAASGFPTDELQCFVGSQMTINVRSHVVITYDGSTNVSGVKFYIDGVLKTTTSSADTLTGSTSNTSANFVLGGGGNNDLTGELDEIGIFSKELNQAEVDFLYQNSSGTRFKIADLLGLNTDATAVAADIATGKTAWVNGVKITGTAV